MKTLIFVFAAIAASSLNAQTQKLSEGVWHRNLTTGDWFILATAVVFFFVGRNRAADTLVARVACATCVAFIATDSFAVWAFASYGHNPNPYAGWGIFAPKAAASQQDSYIALWCVQTFILSLAPLAALVLGRHLSSKKKEAVIARRIRVVTS